MSEGMGTGFKGHRYDPYKNFKFRLKDGDTTLLGVSKCGALKRTTEVVTHRSGGENSWDHKSPGRTSWEGIVLERGVTHDAQFEAWANRVASWAGDPTVDLSGYKKDLTLEMMNEQGVVVHRYFLYDCWVSEFTALPELDANANAVAIESIKLELEGWSRDTGTTEPGVVGA